MVRFHIGDQLCGAGRQRPGRLIRPLSDVDRTAGDQRIESAHHPPAGWGPLVSNGTVDALAAVSSGARFAPQQRPRSGGGAVPRRSTPGPSDRRALHTAFAGAAICLLALIAALATASRRHGPGRNGIAGVTARWLSAPVGRRCRQHPATAPGWQPSADRGRVLTSSSWIANRTPVC